VARVAEEAVWLDVRTLLPGEEEDVARRLEEILASPRPSRTDRGDP
jgi:hypothetical protein